MKAKINIELFDNTPASALEEFGLTTKFLEISYKAAFESLVKQINDGGCDYTIAVEIEDNTVN